MDAREQAIAVCELHSLGYRIEHAESQEEKEALRREAGALAERLGKALVPMTREERKRGAA